MKNEQTTSRVRQKKWQQGSAWQVAMVSTQQMAKT